MSLGTLRLNGVPVEVLEDAWLARPHYCRHVPDGRWEG